MNGDEIAWMFFVSILIMSINDLFRPGWFFTSLPSLIFFGFLGVLAGLQIIISVGNENKLGDGK